MDLEELGSAITALAVFWQLFCFGCLFSLYPHSLLQQQNVKWSGSHMQISQTLQLTSPVLLGNSRCLQAPLKLSKVPSDAARAFSAMPESSCSYGGQFKML